MAIHRLLIISRQCSTHNTPSDEGATATETLRGPWILEPENDPNNIGTPITEADIAKLPTSELEKGPDADFRVAEHSVLQFLTELLAKDRFKGNWEWTNWELISLEYQGTSGAGPEWTERFGAIIERENMVEQEVKRMMDQSFEGEDC